MEQWEWRVLDWKIDVNKFFNFLGVLENKQVKMVAIRLKSNIVVRQDKLVVQRQSK